MALWEGVQLRKMGHPPGSTSLHLNCSGQWSATCRREKPQALCPCPRLLQPRRNSTEEFFLVTGECRLQSPGFLGAGAGLAPRQTRGPDTPSP